MVEVLVALVVLMVGLLGTSAVFIAGHREIGESGRDTAAAVVAQSLAENLRNQSVLELPFLNGLDTADPSTCPDIVGSGVRKLCADWIAQVSTLPEGRGTVVISPMPNPATGITLHRITISLSWAEPGRGTRNLTLTAGRTD